MASGQTVNLLAICHASFECSTAHQIVEVKGEECYVDNDLKPSEELNHILLPSVVESHITRLNKKCKAAFSVLIVIAADTWLYDRESTLTQRDIIKRTGLSADGVVSAIKELIACKLIKIKSIGKNKLRTFRLDYGDRPSRSQAIGSADHPDRPSRSPSEGDRPSRSPVSPAAMVLRRQKARLQQPGQSQSPPSSSLSTSSRLNKSSTSNSTKTRTSTSNHSEEEEGVREIMLHTLHFQRSGTDRQWELATRLYTERGKDWFTSYCEWFMDKMVPRKKGFVFPLFVHDSCVQEFDSFYAYTRTKPNNPRAQVVTDKFKAQATAFEAEVKTWGKGKVK